MQILSSSSETSSFLFSGFSRVFLELLRTRALSDSFWDLRIDDFDWTSLVLAYVETKPIVVTAVVLVEADVVAVAMLASVGILGTAWAVVVGTASALV
eukprot:CAMPEP_0114420592 /NCGR_PEP_ID=MMETSP0103-20121206/4637_1 /TAXON_ID=37642 ORGANISM="Paraphysomonas imperforata, Strain PA2" /NCGR_SAMPLE_ID=MMETSP0103 /ASSEMBLY_ACC=CAM_ASM_000201 /LENGTH=97 /DNA_ID=CAMNT_0001589077 /DNA_START=1152 /DNA_END=1442 /DNA_ORIENTATION=+